MISFNFPKFGQNSGPPRVQFCQYNLLKWKDWNLMGKVYFTLNRWRHLQDLKHVRTRVRPRGQAWMYACEVRTNGRSPHWSTSPTPNRPSRSPSSRARGWSRWRWHSLLMSLLSRWPWATRWTGAGGDPLLQSKTEHRISLLYLDLISLICGLISISNL